MTNTLCQCMYCVFCILCAHMRFLYRQTALPKFIRQLYSPYSRHVLCYYSYLLHTVRHCTPLLHTVRHCTAPLHILYTTVLHRSIYCTPLYCTTPYTVHHCLVQVIVYICRKVDVYLAYNDSIIHSLYSITS